MIYNFQNLIFVVSIVVTKLPPTSSSNKQDLKKQYGVE